MHTLLLLDEFREGISMIFVGNVSSDGVNENYLLAKEILLSIGVSFNIVFSFKNACIVILKSQKAQSGQGIRGGRKASDILLFFDK